tara:strand:+ start:75 stop:497 length:423 start_codon:yes stop_codon:yes gene_type:complete
LSFKKLKQRIKHNEGYSEKPYKDKLGFDTVGFGHLIKPNEKKYFKKSFSKKYFEIIFDQDFARALSHYEALFYKKNHNKKEKELLIEMLFQLGPKGVVKFKKMLFHLNNKNKYMVSLEMMDSLWYKQTPKRVENLIKHYI